MGMGFLLPNRTFRKKSHAQTKLLFRVYTRRGKKKKFSLLGAFEELRAAKEFALKSCEQKIAVEYVIKKIEVRYEEETCDQSLAREMAERIPEISGIF